MNNSAAPAPLGQFEASDAKLRRGIGLWGLIALAVSVQVGSGWLLATLAAASQAGPASLISWIIGAAFFGVIAVAWLELGTMLPRSGAGVRYPRLTHGAFLSWFNGWGYLVAFIVIPPIEAEAVLTYLGGHWPGAGLLRQEQGATLLAWPNGILCGLALLLVFLAINVLGVRLLSESNKYVSIWKLIIPTATFVMMLTAFHGSNFTASGFAPEGVGAIFTAVSGGGVVFAYAGVRQIIDFGGEVKDPQRTIPVALVVGGLLIPLALYLLLQLGFIGSVDWASAGLRTGDWAGLVNSSWASAPLLNAVTAAGFAWFAGVLLSDAALSPSATGWVFLGVAGRTAYSVSVNGELPWWLRRMNRFGVPWLALTLSTVIGFVLFLPMPSWYEFVGVVSTALALNYLLAGPTLAVLRKTAPDLPRPVFVRAAGFWAPAGYVASLLLVYFAGWGTLIKVMTLVFLALPIYASYTSVHNGWSPRAVSAGLSALFTAVWLYAGWQGGWLFSVNGEQAAGSWSFAAYFGALAGSIIVFLACLWLISSSGGRTPLRAGLWIVPTLLVTLLVSYLGEYGPLTHRVLGDGLDFAVIVAVGLASYVWAVRSGGETPELRDILSVSEARASAGAAAAPPA